MRAAQCPGQNHASPPIGGRARWGRLSPNPRPLASDPGSSAAGTQHRLAGGSSKMWPQTQAPGMWHLSPTRRTAGWAEGQAPRTGASRLQGPQHADASAEQIRDLFKVRTYPSTLHTFSGEGCSGLRRSTRICVITMSGDGFPKAFESLRLAVATRPRRWERP